MLPWPTHTGVSESPRGNYRVRGPYSSSGDSRYIRKNAEGVSWSRYVQQEQRKATPTYPPTTMLLLSCSLAANWTGPDPVGNTGQGPGMSWDPARVDGMGVGRRASAPLQLQARGPSLTRDISLPKVLWGQTS